LEANQEKLKAANANANKEAANATKTGAESQKS